MTIIWSAKAEKQLDNIFSYIASDSEFYAHHTIEQIIQQVESFLEHPKQGRKVPEYDRDAIREVFHHPYRIIYLLAEKKIIILSVIHGARLLPKKP